MISRTCICYSFSDFGISIDSMVSLMGQRIENVSKVEITRDTETPHQYLIAIYF